MGDRHDQQPDAESLERLVADFKQLCEDYIAEGRDLVRALDQDPVKGERPVAGELADALRTSVADVESLVLRSVNTLLHIKNGGAAKEAELDPDDPNAVLRRSPRVKRRFRVRYTHAGSDTVHTAFSRDVGPNGLFLAATHGEEVGTVLNLEVDIPDGRTVRLAGVVAWTKWLPANLRKLASSGFGVKLIHAPKDWTDYFDDEGEVR